MVRKMYVLAGLPGDSTISPLKEIVENCDASVFENDILKHMVSLQGTAARPLYNSSTPAVDEDACGAYDVVQDRQYFIHKSNHNFCNMLRICRSSSSGSIMCSLFFGSYLGFELYHWSDPIKKTSHTFYSHGAYRAFFCCHKNHAPRSHIVKFAASKPFPPQNLPRAFIIMYVFEVS